MHLMMTLARCLLAGLLLLLTSACAGYGQPNEQGPVLVESLLSDEEFEAAGLGALSEEELTALNRALTRALSEDQTAEADEAMLAAWARSDEDEFATFGFPDEHPLARRHDSMATRLAVGIDSWPRGRHVQLANDQLWALVRPGGQTFGAVPAGTQVVIRRAAMGSFVMRVGERNQTLRVRRLE